MDPVTLILSALAVGAAASVKETASEVVLDGYHGLKALIQHKFEGNEKAQLAFTNYEQKPEVWKAPLAEEMQQGGLGQDQELLTLAKQLLEKTQQATVSKYVNNFTGSVQGFAQGDQQQITMNFGQPPHKEQ